MSLNKLIEYCSDMGFHLEVVELDARYFLINVIDENKSIYKSGKKQGSIKHPLKMKDNVLYTSYSSLFELILKKLYN
ncbi:hypothetical protein [Abyssalbus ytuae]|uniref:Uncharacterized protein n=1 Tax=Abyssalbus ytuae TaxID=2926907 RepID=A0A9E6ZTV3_9FLAO|nr:hypothetical protein [Abyssalbus ytuae]UOB16606.1 hypothetical protein MQE35_12775 [Abyssalbus ytuae]